MRGLRTTLVLLSGAVLFSGCAGTQPGAVRLEWPPPPAEPSIVYTRSIGGSQDLDRSFWGKIRDFLLGSSPDQSLNKPYGLAWDEASRLYIADTGNKSVVIVDLKAGTVRRFSSLGPYGRLAEPVNVLLHENEVYVADTGLSRIVVFDREGLFQRFVGSEGDLVAPVGMAFGGEQGYLYVTDTQLHEVRVFNAEGGMEFAFGGRGDERGQFYHPLGVAVSSQGIVYVVDAFHFAVQAFDLGGDYQFSFGPKPTGVGSMARPRAIAMDSDSHLYVTDALRNNVQVYDPQGNLLMDFGTHGLEPGRFRLPAGICVTKDDRIFVADSINQRIQEFAYVGEPRKP